MTITAKALWYIESHLSGDERYDARFDPHSGAGGLEIWVPVKA